MKYFLFFLIFFYQNTFSQTNQVSGIVINGDDNSKLASASIFINNSSKSTISNTDGKFTIQKITEKNFELVISYTGFVTVSVKITPQNIGQFHTIKMVPRKESLEEISIMVPEKDGWKKWENFLQKASSGNPILPKNAL